MNYAGWASQGKQADAKGRTESDSEQSLQVSNERTAEI